ncbi:hypothetical protein M422DRAFT_37392 [Sphaerobolus stellatus SS14]|uniref:NADP-dependent oxidoreductase domain-containing protein n=1 Tax=Sphaerobolus stellatus (strain SS14) TaxID=990650 RepID=A0A0C9USL9_SPHS4|nr:hypothetical protein M422DRAFT_37392 [Sphaerobolus stellatus SS14]
MPVATRKIGDREFPAIGFGGMVIAYELRCTHWDTSISYGESEDVIGKWFERNIEKRSDIFFPDFIRQCLEQSLKRLKTDCIDLYYVHRIQKEQPIEVTVRALSQLVKEHKIKHIGLSECSSATLRRAHAVHPIAAVQLEYSPFQLEIEDEKIGLLKTARELGVKVVAYSPLSRGLLPGRFMGLKKFQKSVDDLDEGNFRRFIPMYTEDFDKVLGIAEKLKEIDKRHNNATLEIQLSESEVAKVRQAINDATLVLEDRYPAVFEAYSFADTAELKE